MNCCKQILLYLNSNISNYNLSIYDCNGYSVKRITSQNYCLCLNTNTRYLRVVANPPNRQYNNSIFYKLDTYKNNCFNLYFNFTANQTTLNQLNIFYLTDRNYGLKLNGNLQFNLI